MRGAEGFPLAGADVDEFGLGSWSVVNNLPIVASCPERATVRSATPPREAVITVGYGHADKLAAIAAAGAPVGSTKPALLIDPALYRRDDVRPVLAERDIAALYLILKDEGVTQRQIAELTGQSQSEVSEILKGRKVLSYDLLVRIAVGLGIPRG